MTSKSYNLSQVNISRMIAPLSNPIMADFVAELDSINKLADSTPGFVWRLQTEEGNATSISAYDDELILFNLSVWESIDALKQFVYRSQHGKVMRDRKKWFQKSSGTNMALWWLPMGHIPTVEASKKTLCNILTIMAKVLMLFHSKISFLLRNQLVSIKISKYNSQYQAQIIDLILKIQQKEFGVSITLEDQPDLLGIPNFYQQDNGNFWVALDKDKVIGTIAAIDIANQNLALRKMFVDSNYRGYGVGKKLLKFLVSWAEERNVREIYLGTIDKFKVAHKFYEKNNFVRVTKSELPDNFPIMLSDNIFYRLTVPTHYSVSQ